MNTRVLAVATSPENKVIARNNALEIYLRLCHAKIKVVRQSRPIPPKKSGMT
jgi:hypothetical protein